MAKKSIKLSEEDFEYFIKLTDAHKEFESRFAALEITKLRLYDEYKVLNESLANFTSQIKVKYNVPVNNAEIDDATKCLVYEDGEEEKIPKKQKNDKKS